MNSGNKPKCIRCGRDDRVLLAKPIPAHVKYQEMWSGSGPLYPVALAPRPVQAGAWISCRCGFEGEVAAPEGWRPDEA